MGFNRIRIFVVDDSVVMQSFLRSVISLDPSLELAGTALNGASALRMFSKIVPDMILLDVEMPVMDGLATLRSMRALGLYIPVIMCSSLTHRGAIVTIEALACGASDYIAKPSGHSTLALTTHAFARELLPKIHALTSKPVTRYFVTPASIGASSTLTDSALGTESTAFIPKIVVIGVSTGGPAALEALLPALPANFPLPVLIVQHMPELFTQILAERLRRRCSLNVREAAEGDQARAGTIFIARGNWHLEITSAERRISRATLHLSQSRPENHCRPSVDVLFRSASSLSGSGVLAVVLTGMGSDGLEGARIIRSRGGKVIVQDESSSTVWGMPGAVAQASLAHRILPLHAIGAEIIRLVRSVGPELKGIWERQVS